MRINPRIREKTAHNCGSGRERLRGREPPETTPGTTGTASAGRMRPRRPGSSRSRRRACRDGRAERGGHLDRAHVVEIHEGPHDAAPGDENLAAAEFVLGGDARALAHGEGDLMSEDVTGPGGREVVAFDVHGR